MSAKFGASTIEMWKTSLLRNWEKCHFMVKDEILLRHKILKKWYGSAYSQYWSDWEVT